MSTFEKLVALAFIGTFAGVYVSAASILIRWAFRRLTGKKRTPSRCRRWIDRAVLGLAAVGALCVAYGYFIEPYWVEVTKVSLSSDKLPAGTRPIRLVHISDLHCDPKPRLEDRLPDIVAQLNPDVIVFTGDAVNSPGGVANFKRCMSRLAQVAPVFVVRGNWDWETDAYSGTGVRELDGEAARLEVGEAEVWIAGVSCGRPGLIDKTIKTIPPGRFTILLYHRPCEVLRAARLGVDLHLAGHTHGGQVALPFYGAVITLSKYGKRYERGLYREEGTWLYINRGIGMEGRFAPRVRFFARPEVTLIEISPLE